jgi:hypothetical protein
MSDTESDSSDNNIKVRKSRMTKDVKYKKEQKEVFKRVKKYIKYDEDDCSFSSLDINQEKIKGEIYDDIKKYFHSKNTCGIDVNSYKGPMSLIRNVFKCNDLEIISKNAHSKDEDGNKIVAKKYIAIKTNKLQK